MVKISQREKSLLGYGSNSLSNSSSRRNSEVDFSDVFGGPPRCSAQDLYYNEIEQMDCMDDVDNDADDVFRCSKPVFGDQMGVRRRYPSEDFYDDIFGGDQPLSICSLSPRVHIPFSSAPGSRAMSPSRPLSPAAELSGSPSNFSLPGRISNTDYMTSTSTNQSSKSSGRSLSRLSQTFQNNLVYRSSSLSRQIPIDGKEPTSDSKFSAAEYEAEFIINANDDIQFHFSIYKWANKGVPIAMSSRKRSPSRSKEKGSDVLSTENTQDDVTIKDDSFFASKRRMASTTQVREWDMKEGGLSAAECIYKSATDKLSNKLDATREVPDHSQNSLYATTRNSSPKIIMRPLASLFGDDKEDNETSTANKGEKECEAKEKKKVGLNNVFSSDKVNKIKVVHELYSGTKNEIDRSEVAAKVKDFVKIFNQDSAWVKTTTNGVGPSTSWRWKDKDAGTNTFVAQNEGKMYSTQDHDEMQAFSVSMTKNRSESIEMVDVEYLSEEQKYTINSNDSVSESKIENVNASIPKIISSSIDKSLGKERLQDIDLTQVATENQDEIQSYELKVKQWSKGKEGNIRALLSTMQCILWPNSGWKPIPLVDIIEANAVKKSYQRALLCLHPDKLQQKGAAPYQKFIAERVFDILQEAWDQFNLLGHL